MNMNLVKRALCLLLSLVLLLGNVPITAFATEENATEPIVETIVSTEEPTAVQTTVTEAPTEPTAVPTQATVPEETTAPTVAPKESPEGTVPATEGSVQENSDEVELVAEQETVVPDLDLPGNQELHTVYAEQILYGNGHSLLGTAAGARLSGDEKVLYDALVPTIKQIACGERASAVIGIGQTVTDMEGNTYTADVEATFTGAGLTNEAMMRVTEALLSDLPFEMYWYDKTVGCGFSTLAGTTLVHVQVTFSVAGNYQGAAANTVDTAKTSAAATAASNAEQIVSEYAAASDYEKLIGYRDEICALVSYNDSAADAGNFSENDDPWQLVYVFDGNTSTNVVCEGYSKAFMYLCDLTSFSGDVTCYTVSGQMDGGDHMWNIVTLEGNNYLVDVTNGDTGTIGADGSLFLAGGTGSVAGGYSVSGISYTYDSYTKSLWGTDAGSILSISAADYEPTENESGEDETEYVASGTCGDDLTWILDKEGVLTISGNGEMTSNPWMNSYSDAIKSIVIKDGVTSIGDEAFRSCGNLTRVTIGNGVTRIGWGAFAHCGSLDGIWVSDDNRVYCNDASGVLYTKDIKTLVQAPGKISGNYKILDGVTRISDSAFSGCKKLTGIEIPDGVTSISWGAFSWCSSLKSIRIPNNVTSIGYAAFQDCGLTSINIPDSVTSIGDCAFVQCSDLKSVAIGNGVTSIGESVFADCSSLASIAISDNVTSIASSAFQNCGSLEDIYYGDTEAQWTALSNHPAAKRNHYSCMNPDYHWETVCVDATFTKSGYTYEKCSCGYERNKVTTDDALGLPEPVVQVVSNTQTGGGTLSWEHDGEADCYEVYRATSKKGKYTLLTSASSNEVEVSAAAGKTYYYKVKAICEADASLSSGYSAVVKVTGTCAQPQITVEANAASGKPAIQWSKISGAKKYEVYRADAEDGAYKKVKTTTSVSYADTSAAVGTTYFYKVKAIASKSAYNSVYSEAQSCLTRCAQPVVTMKINADTGKPTLNWKVISDAVDYEILRAESADGDFVKLTTQPELTYTDLFAVPDKDYWYKVNAIGASEELNSIDGTAKMIHATLAKPVVTFAVDDNSGKPVLTWDKVDGAVEYKVYRSTSATKSYKEVSTTRQLEFTDTSASVGKGYYYKVIAIGENCRSVYSAYKKLTAKCAQPEISVEANAASGKPVISWSKVSGAKKYYVYRVDETGTRTSLGSTTKTTFTDSKAVVGTTYSYQVRANGSKSAYNSIYSETVDCLTVLAQPIVKIATVAATGKPILSWKAVTGAAGYEIYRSVNNGTYELIATQTELTFTDENTVVDGVYSYKVKAIADNTALNSADGTPVIVTAACAQPVASIALNGKKPMVSWGPVEGAIKYEVYRSTKKGSGYKKVATVEEGESYTDSKAKKGSTYCYNVVAVSENTSSAQSAYVKIKSK